MPSGEVRPEPGEEMFINIREMRERDYSNHVKRVSRHSAESREFSPGAPVSSHKEVDRVG